MTAQIEACALSAAALRIGLIGRGISRSRTPAMQVAEARAHGLACTCAFLDPDEPEHAGKSLPEILDEVERQGYAGVNVTYPYKIEVIPLLDELSPNAMAVGAVNTVVFANGRRSGHNTDLWGFAESFRHEFGTGPHPHALLIGAGGAGVAVAHALADCGVRRLSIYDMDSGRAGELAHQVMRNRPGLAAQAVGDLPALIARARPDGIVNATPMGMAKLPGSAFPPDLLSPGMWVTDIVYFPLETELLKAARARGCRTLPGSGMAVCQAVRSFRLFTGRAADPVRMKATFDAFDRPARQASEN